VKTVVEKNKCFMCGKERKDVEEIEEEVFLCLDCRSE